MDVENVSAGKYAWNRSFKGGVDNGAGCYRGEKNAGAEAQFVFRYQTAGKKQRITLQIHLGSRNWHTVFIHPGDS